MTDNANNNNEEQQKAQAGAQAHAHASQQAFELLRLYLKNSSLETPDVPAVFQTPWKPELKVEFGHSLTLVTKAPEEAEVKIDLYEAVLRVTVTCKIGDKTAYICEINQAGLFGLRNIDKPGELEVLEQAVAPNILFPYAREAVSSFVNRGSFPALNLAPVDFALHYRVRKAREQQAARQAAAAAKDEQPVA